MAVKVTPAAGRVVVSTLRVSWLMVSWSAMPRTFLRPSACISLTKASAQPSEPVAGVKEYLNWAGLEIMSAVGGPKAIWKDLGLSRSAGTSEAR